jgi:hypothetical protein
LSLAGSEGQVPTGGSPKAEKTDYQSAPSEQCIAKAINDLDQIAVGVHKAKDLFGCGRRELGSGG